MLQTKKIVSLLLVAVLCIAIAAPVYAEDLLLAADPIPAVTAPAAKTLALAVEASASSAKAGDSVVISVVAENGIPGLYLIELTAKFDAAKVEFVSFEKGDAITASDINVNSKANADNVIVRVQADKHGDIVTAGKTEIVKFTFTAKADLEKLDGVFTLEALSSKQASKDGTAINATVKNITSVLYGDVTADGKVNLFDLVRLQKYISDNTTECNLANADVTADGKVNLFDLVRLQKYISDPTSVVLGPAA